MPLIFMINRRVQYLLGIGTRISNEYRDKTASLGLNLLVVKPKMSSTTLTGCSLNVTLRKISGTDNANICRIFAVDQTSAPQQKSLSWGIQPTSILCVPGVSTTNYFTDYGVTE